MFKQDIKGKAQTVLGLIDGSKLGITLPHEHLFIDMACYFTEPLDIEEKKLARQKITMENLWYVRHNRFSSKENLVLDDEGTAIREAMYFKEAGGKTIVNMSCINIGRNPTGLVNVAKATGLNIIMGTSYYIAQSYTPEMKMDSKTEEDIAKEFIRDIKVGAGDTGIKAGIIGEIGCSWPLEEGERKVLRAAGIAQQETGAAINVHPGAYQDAPFEYIKILEGVGADLSRLAFSHTTRTFPIAARDARAKLAERGCYLEYDMFGRDADRPTPGLTSFGKPDTSSRTEQRLMLPQGPYDFANDTIRVNEIMELIEDGFLDRILVSQDVCFKIMLRTYGGGGYSYILEIIVPQMMRAKGMTEEQINTILVENPKRINTFA